MKQLGLFLLPPGWDASPSRGTLLVLHPVTSSWVGRVLTFQVVSSPLQQVQLKC